MIRPYATISGIAIPSARLVIATLAARSVEWYTEIITPPQGCYQALLSVRQEEAPISGQELQVIIIGVNEAIGGEPWSTPATGAYSLHEPVNLAQYGNAILVSPHVTDGGPGTTRLWTRRGVIDRRIRIWFRYTGTPTTYTYGAALHFIY
jgi:hypothetical protein